MFHNREELRRVTQEKRVKHLAQPQEEQHWLLVPKTASNKWLNSQGMFSKE